MNDLKDALSRTVHSVAPWILCWTEDKRTTAVVVKLHEFSHTGSNMGIYFESALNDTIAVIVAACFVAYFVFLQKFEYWKQRGVFQVEPSFPFGNFSQLFMKTQHISYMFADLYNKIQGHPFGGVYRTTSPALMLVDPDVIKTILVKDFDVFHSREFVDQENRDPLSAHLFNLGGKRWRNLRTKLSPTFTSGKMKMMFQTVTDCGNEIRDVLKDFAKTGEQIEIKEYLARYSTDIIASVAFGLQVNCMRNPDAEFRQWGKRIFTPSYRTRIIQICTMIPFVRDHLPVTFTPPDITKYFISMVADTIAYREKNNIIRNDFMQLLIQLKNKGYIDPDIGEKDKRNGHNEEGKEENPCGDLAYKSIETKIVGRQLKIKDSFQGKLTLNEVAAQAFVFFLAGFETSSTTMSFCLHELVVNPDIQTKVQKEIDEVLKKSGGKLNYDDVIHMEYLNKVVAETLRKYPPLAFLNRVCDKNYQIPNTKIVIEEGTNIFISTLGLHNDPKYFPNPEKFDPERFTEEEKSKRHPYVYLPFGEGPRICIGMRFGLVQTKVGLISLLSKYRFSRCEQTVDVLKMEPQGIVLSPVGGLWMKINERLDV